MFYLKITLFILALNVVEIIIIGKNKVREVEDFSDFSFPVGYSKRHMITAVLIVSMIWLFIFCATAFYCQATRGRKVLYEGCPPPPSSPSYEIISREEKKEPTLNFQFLVRFFKRNNEANIPRADDGWGFELKPKNRCDLLQKQEKQCVKQNQEKKKKTLKDKICALDEGDYFTQLFPCTLPAQHFLTSYSKPRGQKPEERPVAESKSRNQGQGDQIQMLWKKPSVTAEGRDRKSRRKRYPSTRSRTGSEEPFGRTTSNSCSGCLEDRSKDYSTGKQTSTCYCSESCPFVQTTSTTTSTQLPDKLSSATLQFFEEVIGKRKLKPSTTQDSTAESDSECSTTSETDY